MNQKHSIEKPELHSVPVHSPWFHVGIDFVGPISPPPASGNSYILTLSDYYTKWVKAVPLPTKEAHGMVNALLHVHTGPVNLHNISEHNLVLSLVDKGGSTLYYSVCRFSCGWVYQHY